MNEEKVDTAGKGLCHRCAFCYSVIWTNNDNKGYTHVHGDGRYCSPECAYEERVLRRLIKKKKVPSDTVIDFPIDKVMRFKYKKWLEMDNKFQSYYRDELGAIFVNTIPNKL